jgi:DNA-binding transcriptional LysR family regulator
VRLADRTRREVADAATATDRLPVLATAACAEHVVDPMVAAFARNAPRAAVDVTVGSTDCASGALADGSADLALGVRPVPPDGVAVESVPFLRYARIAVAALGAPATGRRWLTGPAGFEEGTAEERWAAGIDPGRVELCTSEAAALDRVRAGDGLMLALGHAVRDDLRRGSLVRLPLPGTPVEGLWWASVPGDGRVTPAARALQRFLTTPEATTALMARPGREARARPRVRVELWS